MNGNWEQAWQFFVQKSVEFFWTFNKVLLAIAMALLLHYVVVRVMRRIIKGSRWSGANDLVKRVKSPSRILMTFLAVQFMLAPLPPEQWTNFRHIVTLGIIASTVHLAIAALREIERQIKRKHPVDVQDNFTARKVHTQVTVLRRAAVTFVVLVGLALALMTFPRVRELGASLLASAGLAGLLAGLAARPVLENLIAGVQIALTQPVNLDDVVIVEGEWGWVEEIRPTYIVVRIWDQRRLIVPFSKFIQEPFQNWTRRTAELLGSVFVHVDYTVPVQEVRDELQRIVSSCDKWDGRAAVLQVTDATERTVQLRALVSAANSPDAWELRVFVREKLIEFLQQRFPHCLPKTRVDLPDGRAEVSPLPAAS